MLTNELTGRIRRWLAEAGKTRDAVPPMLPGFQNLCRLRYTEIKPHSGVPLNAGFGQFSDFAPKVSRPHLATREPFEPFKCRPESMFGKRGS